MAREYNCDLCDAFQFLTTVIHGYNHLPGMPWSLPLCVFLAGRSDPFPCAGKSVNRLPAICLVKVLSEALAGWSLIPSNTAFTPVMKKMLWVILRYFKRFYIILFLVYFGFIHIFHSICQCQRKLY